jgi:hypothetical protein
MAVAQDQRGVPGHRFSTPDRHCNSPAAGRSRCGSHSRIRSGPRVRAPHSDRSAPPLSALRMARVPELRIRSRRLAPHTSIARWSAPESRRPGRRRYIPREGPHTDCAAAVVMCADDRWRGRSQRARSNKGRNTGTPPLRQCIVAAVRAAPLKRLMKSRRLISNPRAAQRGSPAGSRAMRFGGVVRIDRWVG